MLTRERAVVLGGGIAGLVAARVLSDFYAEVHIIERDTLPTNAVHRGGVPQGRHVHGLLMRGAQLLDELFPGFTHELEVNGAPRLHWMRDTVQLLGAGFTPSYDSGVETVACSRPFLEHYLRRRVLALPNINLISGQKVIGLVADVTHARVTGVRLAARHGDHDADHDVLSADLVVDASGRGSHAPAWLSEHGYAAPPETHIDAGLGYATRVYQMRDGYDPGWKAILMLTTPARPRGGVFTRIEHDRWVLTLAGTAGDFPPTDEAGLLAFAHAIPAPSLHEALAHAEPLTPIYGYRRTDNQMRHYEKLERMPSGFIVMGDAVCAFNPVYGQGMTAATLGACVLRDWHSADDPLLDGRAFQSRLASAVADPWLMATSEDLRYATGHVPLSARVVNGYVDWLMRAAVDVPEVTQAFLQVLHLVKPSASLFHPRLIVKRLRSRV